MVAKREIKGAQLYLLLNLASSYIHNSTQPIKYLNNAPFIGHLFKNMNIVHAAFKKFIGTQLMNTKNRSESFDSDNFTIKQRTSRSITESIQNILDELLVEEVNALAFPSLQNDFSQVIDMRRFRYFGGTFEHPSFIVVFATKIMEHLSFNTVHSLSFFTLHRNHFGV